MTPNQEVIREAVKDILKDHDLALLTGRMVRNELQEKFDKDFSDRRKEIDDILMEEMKKITDAKNESTLEDGNTSSSDFSDVEDKVPIKKAKKLKKSVESSAHELEENGGRSRRKAAPTFNKLERLEKWKERMKKREEKTGVKREPRKMILSETLSEILGEKEMARSEVVKKIWGIIRENNMQDPKNKQFILCDESFVKLFGCKRFRGFGMMKYLSKHIVDPRDCVD